LIRKIKDDVEGQSALFDAVMFLVIMIVAYSLITVYAASHSKDVELEERQDMMEYARECAEVVLGATLSYTWYEDIQGRIIEKPPGDTTVLTLILEELYLMDFGVPEENFALGYEKDIKTLTRNLVASSYHFAILGHYLNESANAEHIIFISDIIPDYTTKTEASLDGTDYTQSMPRSNLASCEIVMPLIDKGEDAKITFSLWN
jgi:hypothetical protein